MKPQERYAALPLVERRKLRIAFDCDETLWKNGNTPEGGKPNLDIVFLFRALRKLPCHLIVWSAGGKEWAERVSLLCGIRPDECLEKPPINSKEVDLAIDDYEDLGIITLFV